MSRLLLVVLGLWLGLLLASWVIATVNFRSVDRVLGPELRPELDQRLAGISAADRRAALRHLASEINRWTFRHWSLAQLALGALALGLAWRVPGAPRVPLVVAFALALAQALAFVGPITDLGRSLDFLPRPLPPAIAHRFGMLHAAYVGGDAAKAGSLIAGVVRLIRRTG